MKRCTILLALAFAFNLCLPNNGAFIPTAQADEGAPRIIIRETKDDTMRLFAHREGWIYKIEVIPKNKHLPSYFLVRPKPGGKFFRTDDPEFLIPEWKIFEW